MKDSRVNPDGNGIIDLIDYAKKRKRGEIEPRFKGLWKNVVLALVVIIGGYTGYLTWDTNQRIRHIQDYDIPSLETDVYSIKNDTNTTNQNVESISTDIDTLSRTIDHMYDDVSDLHSQLKW